MGASLTRFKNQAQNWKMGGRVVVSQLSSTLGILILTVVTVLGISLWSDFKQIFPNSKAVVTK